MLYTELDIEDILADARGDTQWESAPSNERAWLLRLESEIRKAYAASWQQESFNNAEVEYILRMLDVERA